jgi:ABC-type nitrate/sulfonate/bicarbonate transport system, permease component
MRHVLILAAFLLLWTSALALFSVPDYLVPSPYQLAEKTWFLATRAGLLWHIPVTVIEIVAGYVIGVLVGIAAALIFYRAPVVEDILNPLIVFIQTAPKIAIAPLLLLWLGLDMTPKVVLVAIVTFFPVLATMLSALRSMPTMLDELARILHLSPLQRVWRLELPQSLPLLFSGLKVAATLAVTAAVIGELMGARAGLGYLLSLGQETSDTQLVLVSVLILSLLGYLLYLAIQAAERRLLRWHSSTDHDNLPI